jgi:tRNA A37 threonylcarbamoyladenosine dehydratase
LPELLVAIDTDDSTSKKLSNQLRKRYAKKAKGVIVYSLEEGLEGLKKFRSLNYRRDGSHVQPTKMKLVSSGHSPLIKGCNSCQ